MSLNAIKPMCDLLTVMDSKIVQVSLNGLENILRLGEQEGKQNGTGINPYCALIEEAYGTALKYKLLCMNMCEWFRVLVELTDHASALVNEWVNVSLDYLIGPKRLELHEGQDILP